MPTRTIHRLVLVALIAAVVPVAHSQRMFSPGHFAPGRSGRSFRGSAYPLGFLTESYYGDSSYQDALYRSGYPVASQPPIVIIQPAPIAAASPVPPPAQPLMIELQGDRYVRISGEDNSGAEMIDEEALTREQKKKSEGAVAAPRTLNTNARTRQESPRALLIFRDGHHEEISDYTIAGGTLYARADYYTNGAWNRQIALSSLNLPETVVSNQSRGLHFRLPSASNEVIVGP